MNYLRLDHKMSICEECQSRALDALREAFATKYNLPVNEGWSGHPNMSEEVNEEWRAVYGAHHASLKVMPCVTFSADCGGDGFSFCFKHLDEQIAEAKNKPAECLKRWKCAKCGGEETSWYDKAHDGKKCNRPDQEVHWKDCGGDLVKQEGA